MSDTKDIDQVVPASRSLVVELTVDTLRDPGGRKLAAAINAQFAREAATRRRRVWTIAVALLGFPSTLAVVCPSVLPPAARRADAAAWAVAAVALTASLVVELRRSRALPRQERGALDDHPRGDQPDHERPPRV